MESFIIKLTEEFLTQDDLLFIAIKIAIFFSFLVFILSIIFKNVSIVDRLWPILPNIYIYLFTLYPVIILKEQINLRLLISTIITTIWGTRLTYNYYRKGGYSITAEDYRWERVKEFFKFSPILFQIFNFTFISFYQNFLLMAIAIPGYSMYLNRNNPLNIYDLLNVFLMSFFLILEIIADQQQWRFQEEKRKQILENKLKDDYKIGFIKSGLFKYSRHPNFLAEMMIWWSYYFFSISASGKFINYSIIGTILLTLLFQGSTFLTEYITLGKYPQYEKYQKSVSRFIPWFYRETKYE